MTRTLAARKPNITPENIFVESTTLWSKAVAWAFFP
jgi:hypothetical protein